MPGPRALLAQIPDLDQNAVPAVAEKRAEGRVISQALSIKLVFGVGLATRDRGDPAVRLWQGQPARSGGQGTSRMVHNGGSTRTTDSTAQTMAPAWPSPPASPATAVPPRPRPPAPAILSPQPPQVGDTRPTALTEPSWPPPRPSVAPAPAVTPSPAPNNYISPPVANTNRPDNRADYRGFDRDRSCRRSAELAGRQPQRCGRAISQ